VSSIGTGAEEFTEGIKAGLSGISEIEAFDAGDFPVRLAGEVHDFDPASIVRNIDLDDWGRTAHFAAAAARLVMDDSGLDLDEETRATAGAIIGTTNGEAPSVDTLTQQWLDGGPSTLSADVARRIPAGNIAAAAATELGLYGETVVIPTACSAANYAIGSAADKIIAGEADVMVAGGADSVNRFTHAGFLSLGAVANGVPRPFDQDRSGIVTAEGGAVLVLEELETPGGAAPTSTPNCSATGSAATPTTSCTRTRRASPPASGGRTPTRASSPRTSTTSAPTAPAHRPTTSPRSRRPAWCSATSIRR
jgi:3-oxoacyl-[acyl-carrier-protein] synthase II